MHFTNRIFFSRRRKKHNSTGSHKLCSENVSF